MITTRVKAQLLVFAVITALGVSYVGVRYARLDRLVLDRSYTVIAHAERSGGIFAGAEVAYRGVRVGRVSRLGLTDDGVDIYLEIDDSWDRIPADARAVVANRSAVGEQYVDLEPNVDTGPFLGDGAVLTDVVTPIETQDLLGDVAATVGSVDRRALRTTVAELGTAFAGTGDDLQRILDTSSSFLHAANANFDVTTALLRDSNTVLRGQVGSRDSLRMFADGLQAFSSSVAGADDDLRRVINAGSFTARQLRTLLERNESAVAELVDDAITTGRVVVAHLPGLRMVLTIYPNAVAGGFTVVATDPATGLYDVHSGLVLTPSTLCTHGYLDSAGTRAPQQLDDRPLPLHLGCTDPPTVSNPRGAQNLPRAAPGNDSWKWLYVRPLLSSARD
ncbi:MAG TPA: MlaD family protein [Nocardioides sp.]|nr:MlaD family protein [Nocardioides sp.]